MYRIYFLNVLFVYKKLITISETPSHIWEGETNEFLVFLHKTLHKHLNVQIVDYFLLID